MYEEISHNKRNSLFLVGIFVLLILILGYVIGIATGIGYYGLIFAAIFSLIMGLTSFYQGDKIVLKLSHARLIQKKDNPQLYNITEEMAIAAGIPLPKIYVIGDTAPNAFATGRKPETASIAVTTGLLQKLKRDQLQGVIAHELSHIRNFDILFCTMIVVLVGVVALLSDFMLRSMFYGSRNRRSSSRGRGSGGGGIIILVGLLLAILAPVFAQIIRFAVSRQREYLADASSAQLTRYPEGLASALERISGDKEVLEVANRATQHLYIVNPIKSLKKRTKNNVFSTHPPIEERIQRLRNMR